MCGHLFAATYDRLTATAERKGLRAKRAELLGPLRGRVVEIGAGTGLNLCHYRSLQSLTLVEPDAAMRTRLQRRIDAAPPPFRVEVVAASAGVGAPLPVPDGGADAAVVTLALCSVGDVAATLAEIRRLLVPGGALVVIEHVAGTGAGRVLQDVLTPLQRVLAGGCRLNRDTGAAIARAGFDATRLYSFPMPGSIRLLHNGVAGVARAPEAGALDP